MPIYQFEKHRPQISKEAYVAPSAIIVGNVHIGSKCYIGHGSILRGDYGQIIIGEGTAIEEAVVIHARPNDKTIIGKEVTVGHKAMLHNAIIQDFAVIGMNSTVSDYSNVGQWAILGEMSLVKNHQIIPDRSIAVGVPARVIGMIQDKHIQMWTFAKQLYMDLARRYPNGMKEMEWDEVIV